MSDSLIGTRLSILVCSILFATATWAVEEAPYTVVARYDRFELRAYQSTVVAETVVQGAAQDVANPGFRILASYIFGGNAGARKIPMTAPVSQAEAAAITADRPHTTEAYSIQFAMPAGESLASLPQPNDSRVQLRTIAARKVAVLRYSGTWDLGRYQARVKELEEALVANGLAWRGEPIWARYDPPWMPWFLRRNEVWLELSRG